MNASKSALTSDQHRFGEIQYLGLVRTANLQRSVQEATFWVLRIVALRMEIPITVRTRRNSGL